MSSTKNIPSVFLFVGFVLLVACEAGEVLIVEDPSVQRAKDIVIIEDYLRDRGYTEAQIDTTTSGVRYVIIDEGMTGVDSLSIDESDIVDFNYTGRLTTDSLFDTSIKSVAEGTRVFHEARNFSPLTTVYTASGWFIDQQKFGGSTLLTGFRDGLTDSFGEMSVGGKVLIAIPSALAYGLAPPLTLSGSIPQNAVLIFELLPAVVIKQ